MTVLSRLLKLNSTNCSTRICHHLDKKELNAPVYLLRTSDLSGSLGDSFNPDPRGVHVFSLCLKTDLTFHVGGEAQLDIRLPFDPWDDRLSPGKERLKLHMISVRMANISVMRHVCICVPCSCRLVARRRCFAA